MTWGFRYLALTDLRTFDEGAASCRRSGRGRGERDWELCCWTWDASLSPRQGRSREWKLQRLTGPGDLLRSGSLTSRYVRKVQPNKTAFVRKNEKDQMPPNLDSGFGVSNKRIPMQLLKHVVDLRAR